MVDGVRWARHGRLTRREQQVAWLLCEGAERREIAERLSMGLSTVDTHRGRVMRKMGVSNEVRLLRYAIVNGLIAVDG